MRLNAVDSKGDIPLDIALRLRHQSLADCLVQHGANVDCADLEGRRLLHKSILRSQYFPLFNIIHSIVIHFGRIEW